jgi:hypothetical protein
MASAWHPREALSLADVGPAPVEDVESGLEQLVAILESLLEGQLVLAVLDQFQELLLVDVLFGRWLFDRGNQVELGDDAPRPDCRWSRGRWRRAAAGCASAALVVAPQRGDLVHYM